MMLFSIKGIIRDGHSSLVTFHNPVMATHYLCPPLIMIMQMFGFLPVQQREPDSFPCTDFSGEIIPISQQTQTMSLGNMVPAGGPD